VDPERPRIGRSRCVVAGGVQAAELSQLAR
jgi:hypothetical protein